MQPAFRWPGYRWPAHLMRVDKALRVEHAEGFLLLVRAERERRSGAWAGRGSSPTSAVPSGAAHAEEFAGATDTHGPGERWHGAHELGSLLRSGDLTPSRLATFFGHR